MNDGKIAKDRRGLPKIAKIVRLETIFQFRRVFGNPANSGNFPWF